MKTYPLLLASILTAPLPMLSDTIVADQDSSQKHKRKEISNHDNTSSKVANIAETKTLDEQVVTAAGYSQHIKEAPASISIIGREDPNAPYSRYWRCSARCPGRLCRAG